MTLRLRSLAGLAALALPLAAMTAATPAATAQAVTCSPTQATVTLGNGNSICQNIGTREYLPSTNRMPAAKQVCTGIKVVALLSDPYALAVRPGSCADVPSFPFPLTVVVVPPA